MRQKTYRKLGPDDVVAHSDLWTTVVGNCVGSWELGKTMREVNGYYGDKYIIVREITSGERALDGVTEDD